MIMSDTFTRSCEHWSEDRRAGMEAFYALATVDYKHLAEAADWRGWLEQRAALTADGRLRLLDVACGSGKFPAALIQHAGVGAAALDEIDYALLDPSSFSVAEARGALKPPFKPSTEYVCTLQDLECPPGAYDIVWATHALYALPREDLDEGLRRFTDAIGSKGCGFIAHASQRAHYLAFYKAYLAGFDRPESEPYLSAEELAEALTRLGVSFTTRTIEYDNMAPDSERGAVEGYLQRCLFDDTLSINDMLTNAETGPYLRACLQDGIWRFPQTVFLIWIQ